MVGSSPGCQRSMLSAEPPSDALPKNRLAVLTLKLSRDGAGWMAAEEFFRSSIGRDSSDSEMSDLGSTCEPYCVSGGAFIAACSSGSSGVRFG